MSYIVYECILDVSHPHKLAKRDSARLPLCCGEPMVTVASASRQALTPAPALTPAIGELQRKKQPA